LILIGVVAVILLAPRFLRAGAIVDWRALGSPSIGDGFRQDLPIDKLIFARRKPHLRPQKSNARLAGEVSRPQDPLAGTGRLPPRVSSPATDPELREKMGMVCTG
jgi:hypothetical protein